MAKNSIHQKTERSPEEKARDKAIRDELKSRPTPEELVASGEYSEPIPQAVVLDAMMLLAQLREAREGAGLTLADLAERTGIDKPALSRLETGRQDNPTLQTILRFANGLGKRIVWSILDESEESCPKDLKTETQTSLPPVMEGEAREQTAKGLIELLLVAHARIAALLAEGYKDPSRFICEQTSGRGVRFRADDWLRPELRDWLTHSVRDPIPSHSPLLTVDWEGRLAFLCSPDSITHSLSSAQMHKILMRLLKHYETHAESCS